MQAATRDGHLFKTCVRVLREERPGRPNYHQGRLALPSPGSPYSGKFNLPFTCAPGQIGLAWLELLQEREACSGS